MAAPEIITPTALFRVSSTDFPTDVTLRSSSATTPSISYNASRETVTIGNMSGGSRPFYLEYEFNSGPIDLTDKVLVLAENGSVSTDRYWGLRSGTTENTNYVAWRGHWGGNPSLYGHTVFEPSAVPEISDGTFDVTDVRALYMQLPDPPTTNLSIAIFSNPFIVEKNGGYIGRLGESGNGLKNQLFGNYLLSDNGYYSRGSVGSDSDINEGTQEYWSLGLSCTLGDNIDSTIDIQSAAIIFVEPKTTITNADPAHFLLNVGGRTCNIQANNSTPISALSVIGSSSSDNFAEKSKAINAFTEFFLSNLSGVSYLGRSSYVGSIVNCGKILGGGDLSLIFSDSTSSQVYEYIHEKTVLTLQSAGYIPARSTDIGQSVTGATSGATGILLSYENLNNIWYVRRNSPSLFQDNESITITSGTGSGTTEASNGAVVQALNTSLSGSRFNSSSSDYYINFPNHGTSYAVDLQGVVFESNPVSKLFRVDVGAGNTLTATVSGGSGFSVATHADVISGSLTFIEPSVAVTISPLVSGSRLKIYDTGTTTLVDGVNSSGTSFSFSTGTAGQGYDIYIVNPGQKSVFIKNYIYPSSSATLPVEQTADINYSATAGAYDITLDGSGIGVSADLWLDTANVEIQLATGNNLSQPTGISLQNLYSFIIESRHSNDGLMPYHDPVVAISATAGEFELRRGWHLKDNTTRDLLRDGGIAQYSAANALEIEWLNITGLGNLATAATPYYWQSDVTNPTIIDSINSGLPNQLVQIFGDASNGNFDLRTFLKLSIRAQGENTVTYDLAAEQDLSSLNPQRYFIPLTTTANPNITIADTAIDANSDGAADIAPFDGMSVTYLDGTGFTAWANSTVYAANAVVSDGGRWYITTAGGTSSGTGVGDDTGVTWTSYSGERQIDGSYYAFNIIYDANNGTLEQMTAYLFWLVRQDVDIDAGSANRTGRAADRIATTRGSDLIMATGGVVDSFAIAAQLTHIPVDVGGTERPYPAPPVGFSAANVADGSRFFLAHEQTFTVAAADINTADNDITLGNDNNGDAAAFASASPYTTVHVNLTSGATMPTTSPQIVDGGRYYATVSSGGMQLFSAESDIPGSPISFSDQGTDSSGSVFTAAAETELYNASVSGGSGVFQTLSLSNGTSVLRKAIYWDNSGTTTATPLFIQRFTWSATAGVSDPQVVNVSSEVDTIHNRIISLTNLELDGEIKNASGVGVTSVTPTNDGSSLSSVYGLVLEGGGGKLQVNSNDSDGIAIWQDLYAWGVFVTSTESGIRLVNADTFTAVNLRTFDLKNLQFDNISSTPLAIVGGIARTIDGSSLLAQPQTGSGGIAFNALALGTGATVETGVSGLTSGESATLAKLDDLTELDGVIYRFTANALEQAPSGGGGGDATAANQTSIINTLASIQGPGFIEATDSLEAIRDRGDTNWITATGFSTHSAGDVRAEIDANSTQLAAILTNTGTDIPVSISALNNLSQADIRTAVGLSSANLDAQLGDIPTVSEFNARTLASADYFDPAADTVANVTTTGSVSGDVGGIVGVTFPASFNNLSSADVQTAATASLDAYDPPTRAELTNDINSILTQGNSAWATADVSGLSTFNHASDQVIVATNNDKSGYSLTQAFPSNFALLAIDGSGQVTTGAMGGTVTVGGYAAGQAPNDLIDISTIQSNVGLILGHTRPMAKQLGLVSGVTATHTPTAITVSDGDGSTTITGNGSDSYTVQGA